MVDALRTGRCVGGPFDGQLRAHMGGEDFNVEIPVVQPMEPAPNKLLTGYYKYDNHNQLWVWHGSQE